jgi:hypothetical protein
MDKRSSKKREHDFAVNAFRVMQEATQKEEGQTEAPPEESIPQEDDGKNPNAVALGRLGGKKGGPARAKKLTPEQRKEIARKAAQARWSNQPQ